MAAFMKKIAAILMKLSVIVTLFCSCKKEPEITPDQDEFTKKLPSISNSKNGLDTFDHVVVLMLENRSFDNLLGYLYKNGVPAGKQFAGLQDRTYICPIPKSKRKKDEKWYVPTHPATDYHAPCPDPGEEHEHVIKQLYNNELHSLSTPLPEPPMNGFVNDYISTLQALGDEYENPTYEQYKKIMACFTPDQVPVLATLAEKFAVFNHWHCSVPSQTWCNRAFWHTGTSGGHVINPGITAAWDWKKNVWDSKNLFQLLGEHDISSAVYAHGPVSLTHLVNGYGFHMSKSYQHFTTDIDQGSLPQYAFIEPKFLGQHNDQHPSHTSTMDRLRNDYVTKEGTVILGEHLIWEVYTAIKNSDQYRDNTLLIITHDEHGGCFDHVSPPAAVPPKPGMKGEQGFQFDRLGLRVPMVMVSSYIQPGYHC